MLDAINNTSLTSTPTGSDNSSTSGSGAFGAALSAAQRAQQRQQQHDSEMDAIKSKGFTTWARDTQIEALKEKLRQQVMAEMGVDEDSLSRLSSVMREILEKKIQEEVDRRMQEETAKQQDGKDGKDANAKGTTTASATTATAQQGGKNDQDGKTCPVIPALSWPGGASLF